MISYPVQIGNLYAPLVFPLISSFDHLTWATGLTPTVFLSKNGGAYSPCVGAVTEILDNLGNHTGVYKVAPNATDANTLGLLALRVAATGASDPQDCYYAVVNFDPLNEPASIWSYGTRTVTGAPPILFVSSPIANSGVISICRRYAYQTDYGNALSWQISTPDLTGATVQLSLQQGLNYTVIGTGSVESAGSGTQTVNIELSNADTASLNVGNSLYSLEADFGGTIIPLSEGTMEVTD